MKRVILIAGALLTFVVVADDMERIDKQHKERIDKEQAEYLKKVRRITAETIRKLELLKKSYLRSKKAEDAKKVEDRIDELKSNPDGELSKVDDVTGAKTITSNTYKSRERKERKAVEETTIGFLGALMKNELEDAYKHMDPYMRRAADKKVLMGYLKIIAGRLQVFKLTPRNVAIDSVLFNDKLDVARVKTKYGAGGKWEVSKDWTWLVRRHGKWYIGDEKEVKKRLFK